MRTWVCQTGPPRLPWGRAIFQPGWTLLLPGQPLRVFFCVCFLAALGLHCFVRAFSSCGERGLLFVVVHGLLIAVASLVAEHGL